MTEPSTDDPIAAARQLLASWTDAELQDALKSSGRRLMLCRPAARAVIVDERRRQIDELERRRVQWAADSWPPRSLGHGSDG